MIVLKFCNAFSLCDWTLAGSVATFFLTRRGKKWFSFNSVGIGGGTVCLGSIDLAHASMRETLCISARIAAVRRFSCPQPSSLASASACLSSAGDHVSAITDGGNPHRQAI